MSSKYPALIVLCAALLSSCSSGSDTTEQTSQALNEQLGFYQMSFAFDNATVQKSQWGALDLTYNVPSHEKYLNVMVNGQWQIQNASLITYESSPQDRVTETYYFDLHNTPGTQSDGVQYGYSITDSERTSPPAANNTATVAPRDQTITTNYRGMIYVNVPPPSPLIGGGILACRRGFPNQDCGPYECVPTAVSNGLKWLDSIYHLGMGNLTSIDSMKAATGWEPHTTPGTGGCTPGAWVQQKINYINAHNKAKAGSMPISTTKYPGAQIATAYNDHWKDNCVFELDIGDVTNDGGHCVSVTCMGQNAKGAWEMKVGSDMQQGVTGGQEVSTITYDPSTNKITSGPAWANGRPILNIIVECTP